MTNAELAILELTSEAPHHGYEIEQVIETRGMREWTAIGFSSIYYLLKKLEKANLVESEVVPTQGRGKARRVYQITPEGREVLRETMLDVLSHPQKNFPAILLGIANMSFVSAEQVKNSLRTYRDDVAERLAYIKTKADTKKNRPKQIRYLFDYSLFMLDAEIKWVEMMIEDMEAENDES